MNLVGGIHTDFVHNNLFYYNPEMKLLEPVVSDINGHGLQTAPKEGERPTSANIFKHVIDPNLSARKGSP